MFDDSIWANADPNDLWLYDKLILSKKLGYKCLEISKYTESKKKESQKIYSRAI